jgi:hypothetical protein
MITNAAEAKVTTTTKENSQTLLVEKHFKGTLEEVTEASSAYAKAQKE